MRPEGRNRPEVSDEEGAEETVHLLLGLPGRMLAGALALRLSRSICLLHPKE